MFTKQFHICLCGLLHFEWLHVVSLSCRWCSANDDKQDSQLRGKKKTVKINSGKHRTASDFKKACKFYNTIEKHEAFHFLSHEAGVTFTVLK